MTMALLGAEMLAPFVTRALLGRGPAAPLQRDYVAAWHRRFDRRIALCRAFHHVLVNAWLIDAASAFSTLAPRLLALGFNRTRDPCRAEQVPHRSTSTVAPAFLADSSSLSPLKMSFGNRSAGIGVIATVRRSVPPLRSSSARPGSLA